MDFVSCKIALGGDSNNVLYRGPDVPVSWPEVRVLQHLHGEDNIFDCEFVRAEHATAQAEKMRLLGLYGSEAVNICFPGSRPMMDMEWPGDRTEPMHDQAARAQADRRHPAIGAGARAAARPADRRAEHPAHRGGARSKGQALAAGRGLTCRWVSRSRSCATS